MVRSLWDRHADAIIDVKPGIADAYPYKFDPMAELLAWWETINKDKYGKHCNNQRKCFSPVFLSVDEMLVR